MQDFEELIKPYVDKVVDKNNPAIFHYEMKKRMYKITNINRECYNSKTGKRSYSKIVGQIGTPNGNK